MSVEISIFIMVLCLFFSAIFSGVETGVLTINRARLLYLVKSKVPSARRLNKYLKNMQNFLSTLLVGNNLVNVLLSTASASLGLKMFDGMPYGNAYETAWSTFVACAIICFGEYMPKLAFRTRPTSMTLRVFPIFRIAYEILSPFTRIIILATRWMMPRKRRTKKNESFMLSREYIESSVSIPGKTSTATPVESSIIRNVLRLKDLRAGYIMTKISNVRSASSKMTLKDCMKLANEERHQRIPIFEGNTNTCIGILNILNELRKNTSDTTLVGELSLLPPCFVVETEPADNLLPLMRQHKVPMLLVHKKGHAKVTGIITENTLLSLLMK